MLYIIAFVAAYLLGSISTSILIGRIISNIDVRDYGSGNAGATNVLRTLGKKAALIVVAGDFLKGVVGVLIGYYLIGGEGALLGGLGAVLGHNFPIYFNFKGGKGIVTSTAVIFMINWKIGLILLIISIFIIAITKYVSLGSIVGTCLYPIAVYFFDNRSWEYITFAIIMAIIAVVRHRQNIKRLIKGEESKIGSKVKV